MTFASVLVFLLCRIVLDIPVVGASNADVAYASQRVVVTFRSYDACAQTSSAQIDGELPVCITVTKCYGRRAILDMSQCSQFPMHASAYGRRILAPDNHSADGNYTQVQQPADEGNSSDGSSTSMLSYATELAHNIFPSNTVSDVEEDAVLEGAGFFTSLRNMLFGRQKTHHLDTPRRQGRKLLSSSTDNQQWNLDMISAQMLWDTYKTHGENYTVAVLDSGISPASLDAYRHTDGYSSRIVSGYDFVSDSQMAMDNDGSNINISSRDTDFYDPGDFDISACPQQKNHSWHGSKVTSVLAANYSGFFGVAPRVNVVPVRVLGRCKTGYASDVADGIVWAAGGNIEGLDFNVTTQGNPMVIMMAFAGMGKCPSYMQTAVDLAISKNVTLFAAAGNNPMLSAMDSFPANCKGVISVGALGFNGKIAHYSVQDAQMYMPGGSNTKPVPCLGTSLEVEYCLGTSISVSHAAGIFLYSCKVEIQFLQRTLDSPLFRKQAHSIMPFANPGLVHGMLHPGHFMSTDAYGYFESDQNMWWSAWNVYVKNAQVSAVLNYTLDQNVQWSNVMVYKMGSIYPTMYYGTGFTIIDSIHGYIGLIVSMDTNNKVSLSWTSICNNGFMMVNNECVISDSFDAAALQLPIECSSRIKIYPPPEFWTIIPPNCYQGNYECENLYRHKTLTNATYGNGVYITDASGRDYNEFQSIAFWDGVNGASGGGRFHDRIYGPYPYYWPANPDDLPSANNPFSDYYGQWTSIRMPVNIYLSYIRILCSEFYGLGVGSRPADYRIYGKNDTSSGWILLIHETNAQYVANMHQAYVSTLHSLHAYNEFMFICARISGTAFAYLNFEELQLFGSEDAPICGVGFQYSQNSSTCVACNNTGTDVALLSECGYPVYFDNETSSCKLCPDGTSESVYPFFCTTCPPGTYLQMNRSCSYCPPSGFPGLEDVQCKAYQVNQNQFIDMVSNRSNGVYSWDGYYQLSTQLKFTINVSNSDNISIFIAYFNVEENFDFVYIALDNIPLVDANSCEGRFLYEGFCYDHRFTRLGRNLQFTSTSGYVQIIVISDYWVGHIDPLSFSWTTECMDGYYDAGNGRCQSGCDTVNGKFLDSATNQCSFCKICQPGEHLTSICTPNQDATCALCPAGTFSNTTDSWNCHACGQGEYAALQGSTVCTRCSPGSFS